MIITVIVALIITYLIYARHYSTWFNVLAWFEFTVLNHEDQENKKMNIWLDINYDKDWLEKHTRQKYKQNKYKKKNKSTAREFGKKWESMPIALAGNFES